jgi:hypothetical protein
LASSRDEPTKHGDWLRKSVAFVTHPLPNQVPHVLGGKANLPKVRFGGKTA